MELSANEKHLCSVRLHKICPHTLGLDMVISLGHSPFQRAELLQDKFYPYACHSAKWASLTGPLDITTELLYVKDTG